MKYAIGFSKRAAGELGDLPREITARLDREIMVLADNPRPPGCKKLKSKTQGYRIRSGDYRVLYTIDDETHSVTVYRVGHRRDVYE